MKNVSLHRAKITVDHGDRKDGQHADLPLLVLESYVNVKLCMMMVLTFYVYLCSCIIL